nr:hypothetical protein [uncultured Actinoplanes sp.]
MDIRRLTGPRKPDSPRLSPERDTDESATLTYKIAMAEYDNARFFLAASSEQAMSRFNFFILLTSAAIAGSSAVTTSANLATQFKVLFAAVAGVLILAVGSLAFQRLAHFDVVRAEYLATINLIRGYLADQAPAVAPFFVIPVQRLDNPWNWKLRPALQNLSTTVSIINSIAAAVVAAALVHTALPASRPAVLYGAGISAGLLCGVIHWFNQYRIVSRGRTALSQRLVALSQAGADSVPAQRRG